ncbi:Peroxisomal membrane signal receptor PTS1 [Pseudocyphellaria aurata]|nr:Peroxisomal membrane signal receptor PTS1 [Pseudocyphellaria aurata]
MSFLGAAECSTGANPLSQFAKHTQDDKSLQRDRLAGQVSGELQEGFRIQRDEPIQDDVCRLTYLFQTGNKTKSRISQADKLSQMMRNFLQEHGELAQEAPQPFSMEHMRRDLENHLLVPPRAASPGWAAEFDPAEQARMEAAFQAPKMSGFNAAEFNPDELQRPSRLEVRDSGTGIDPVTLIPLSMNGYQKPMGIGYELNMGMMGNSYRPLPLRRHLHPRQSEITAKGKGRMVELDDKNWEREFAEIDQATQQDVDAEANVAMEAQLDDMDRLVISETNEFGDFEGIWRSIQAETAAARQFLGDENERLDLGDLPLNDLHAWDHFDSQFHEGLRDPQLGHYLFEEENPFRSAKDPFNEGLRIMNEGGNLSLAALAFEAAVQKNPQHVAAWSHLGSAQAQNEKESPAIRALEQTLKLDPHNLSALMGLAISYTNEGYDTTAYRTLERWLSIKYPQIVPPDALTPDTELGFTDRQHLHEKVTSLFIRAAQLSPHGEAMDPDVQVGLGVLFYGAEQHTKAVDCFEAALASTEAGSSNHPTQAHLLWNRLGATLANSGRSEEAIAAYEKALRLNPNFVRARYNLGVSCINIGCFEEAAQHLLGALSMHRVVEREGMERVKEVMGDVAGDSGGAGMGLVDDGEVQRLVGMNQSTNLLETLRRVFGSLNRRDLAEKVEVGMDVEAFRSEFDF